MRTGIDCKGREWEKIYVGKAKDLSNQIFNDLTVLHRVKCKFSGVWWLCQCQCGNQIICRNNAITSGDTKSCGCYKKQVNVKDLTGQRFGKLVVLERDIKSKKWKCKCDCGNITEVSTGNLQSGATKSCGCLRGFHSHIDAEKYNLVGQQFGYLTVIERVSCPDSTSKAYYKCLCDCGNETIAQAGALRSGLRCSCGKCYHRMSQGELEIKQILDHYNIKYVYDTKYFNDLIMSGGGIGRYDFILLDDKQQPYRLIEFDGRQHFDDESIYYMRQTGQRYQDVEVNDKIKNQYALKHNLPLIRIPYKELRHITYEKIMGEEYLIRE